MAPSPSQAAIFFGGAVVGALLAFGFPAAQPPLPLPLPPLPEGVPPGLLQSCASNYAVREAAWAKRVARRQKEVANRPNQQRNNMWLQISQKNCPNARYDETSWDRVVAFNPFDPEWSCPDEERIGPFALDSNEGGKWICFVPKPGEPCLVYSVGSNYDFSFEKAVKQLNAGCEVHTFDPTTDVARSRALAVGVGSTFHPWAFGRDRSVAQIADELGHSGRRIDILKIDCERCELKPSFLSTFSKCRKGRDGSDPPIGQILMEVHLPEPPEAPFPAVKALFDAFDGCGFRTFHKEPNVEWAGGYNAIEFALVDPRAARESFWRAACPEVPLDAFLQATGYR